jgi:hypothetical protein
VANVVLLSLFRLAALDHWVGCFRSRICMRVFSPQHRTRRPCWQNWGACTYSWQISRGGKRGAKNGWNRGRELPCRIGRGLARFARPAFRMNGVLQAEFVDRLPNPLLSAVGSSSLDAHPASV